MKDTRNLLHRLLVVLAFGSVLHGGQAFAQSELDVVFANSGQDSEICRNQGNFICTEIGLTNHDVATVAAGDIDSDSLLDIVFTNSGGPYPVCFGDGFGGFECTGQIEPASTAEFALGDVNGDGLLDAVTAEMTQSSRVCIGDGAGSFTCTPIAPDIHFTMGVSLGDVDNDGHLDAVYATSIWPYVVCLGDGTGGFSCSDIQSSATENSRDVALGDFNNDGNLDAAFASMSMMGGDAWNGVCLGDGTGDLSCSPVDSPLLETDCVAVGDMDLDGHLDVVFGNRKKVPGTELQICLEHLNVDIEVSVGKGGTHSSELYMNHVVKTKETHDLDLQHFLLAEAVPNGHLREHGILFNDLDCLDRFLKNGGSLRVPPDERRWVEPAVLHDFLVRAPSHQP